MKKSAIIGIALSSVVLTATACAGSSGSGTKNGPKSASITIVANALPAGLDPDSTSSTDSGIEQLVTTNFVGMLYSVNGVKSAAGQTPVIAPDLATGATPSADGKTWTITLRKGVLSSFGNPLTSADVVWTLKRVEAAKVNGASLLSQANIDPSNPATAVDAHTVALHLTAPSALVKTIFSLPSLGIIDSTEAKKHATSSDPYATKWLNAHSASFGPYEVKSITANSEVVLVDNPHYWKGVPQITKATYKTVQDAGTTLQTALTGQSDYTITLPSTDLATVKSSSTVVAHELPVPSIVYMTLDQKNPELKDARVRQAIALATDRTAIANTVYGGTATPTTGCLPTQLTTDTTPYDNSAKPEIAKAKALLAQVPGTHSLTIGTLPSAFPEGATIARIIQSNLGAVGIKVTIKTYSGFGPITADIKSHAIGSIIIEQAPFVIDAGYFFKAFFLGSSLYNFSSYNNATFNSATNAAMAEPAPARDKQIATACSEFLKDAPADMLVKAGNLTVTKKNITNVQDLADLAPRLYNLHVSG